jgi:hypothetical protein
MQTLSGLSVARLPKTADDLYQRPEHRVWRAKVLERAGWRCEAVDASRRCAKAAPAHRLFADHIVEVRDGGALLDLANGQCLCGSHHTAKTATARAIRRDPRGRGFRPEGSLRGRPL